MSNSRDQVRPPAVFAQPSNVTPPEPPLFVLLRETRPLGKSMNGEEPEAPPGRTMRPFANVAAPRTTAFEGPAETGPTAELVTIVPSGAAPFGELKVYRYAGPNGRGEPKSTKLFFSKL